MNPVEIREPTSMVFNDIEVYESPRRLGDDAISRNRELIGNIEDLSFDPIAGVLLNDVFRHAYKTWATFKPNLYGECAAIAVSALGSYNVHYERGIDVIRRLSIGNSKSRFLEGVSKGENIGGFMDFMQEYGTSFELSQDNIRSVEDLTRVQSNLQDNQGVLITPLVYFDEPIEAGVSGEQTHWLSVIKVSQDLNRIILAGDFTPFGIVSPLIAADLDKVITMLERTNNTLPSLKVPNNPRLDPIVNNARIVTFRYPRVGYPQWIDGWFCGGNYI